MLSQLDLSRSRVSAWALAYETNERPSHHLPITTPDGGDGPASRIARLYACLLLQISWSVVNTLDLWALEDLCTSAAPPAAFPSPKSAPALASRALNRTARRH